MVKHWYETIGNTPLVELKPHLYAKIESSNPTGSVKDRAAYQMILEAEQANLLLPGGTIIEPTSGNTGIALCSIAVQRGYKAIICMPDTMSPERIKLMKAFGAQVVLTDGAKGMAESIKRAKELHEQIPNSFIPSQFDNFANERAHYFTTGPELVRDLPKIDYFIAGIGTGGTISGVGKYLKERMSCKVIGVEPLMSPFLSCQKKGKHLIQGIGAGFKPAILNENIIDLIETVSDEDAYDSTRKIMKSYGIFAGISSGAAYYVAEKIHEKFPDQNVVVLFPDGFDRYLSTSLIEENNGKI